MDAIIVRITNSASTATVGLTADSDALTLETANAGAWGNYLRATVDYDTSDPDNQFNLTIEEIDDPDSTDPEVVSSEVFRNLSVDSDDSNYVEKVLEEESTLVRVQGDVPADRPDEAENESFTGGDDGSDLADSDYQGSESDKTGIYALEDADLFNLLCIPPRTREDDIGTAVLTDTALPYCKDRRAILIVDPPSGWTSVAEPQDSSTGVDGLGLRDENAAIYFPRVRMADPLRENRLEEFVPCGVVAGVIARTDAQRGIWKSAAGIEATLSGVRELSYRLTDGENGQLNPLGINCLRTLPVYGNVAWGARTLEGADRLASEWKYLSVRRVALYIEESLYRGMQWAVFEPNDAPLWAQIRLNVGSFMHNLFRQGAFQGKSPKEAYFVKCDSETTTQNDIDLGKVNVLVGFAPLKAAEFVIIQIQQIAGQIES